MLQDFCGGSPGASMRCYKSFVPIEEELGEHFHPFKLRLSLLLPLMTTSVIKTFGQFIIMVLTIQCLKCRFRILGFQAGQYFGSFLVSNAWLMAL